MVANVVSEDGVVGDSNDLLLVSKSPFSVDFKLPAELSSGDEVMVPIVIDNEMSEKVRVQLSHVTELGTVCFMFSHVFMLFSNIPIQQCQNSR